MSRMREVYPNNGVDRVREVYPNGGVNSREMIPEWCWKSSLVIGIQVDSDWGGI